jgi:EAL domain-containing protein (putative c-di-GMP-specific phosphodiesterase class I)
VHRPDVIARLGGDEFGVLVLDAHEKTVQLLAEELRRTVLDYRFKERELIFSVGVSIGVTFFSPGERAPDVLSRADIACYIAKGGGRNAIHVYRSDDRTMMQHHSDLTRVAQLETALDEGRFRLFGQRILRLDGAARDGQFYEVLLRLYEDGAIVPPGAFLPTAARYGFATRIDHWVVDQSFRFLADKRGQGLRLSINLDPRTLDSPDFPRHLQEYRARYGVDPGDVCFEVTENVALENLTRAVETMHKLAHEGFRFALDDFGSGVASFGYLQQLPVQYVKIDGQFIQKFAENPVNPLVVRTLSELARMRGMQCIAECVENETTCDQLAKLGVDFGQGFFLHKPEPLPN